MDERFSYSGSATVDGVRLPNVRLRENPRDGGLRSWEGSASFSMTDAPDGFPSSLNVGNMAPLELPDGRAGQALITNVAFNGGHWVVELQGSGPAPK